MSRAAAPPTAAQVASAFEAGGHPLDVDIFDKVAGQVIVTISRACERHLLCKDGKVPLRPTAVRDIAKAIRTISANAPGAIGAFEGTIDIGMSQDGAMSAVSHDIIETIEILKRLAVDSRRAIELFAGPKKKRQWTPWRQVADDVGDIVETALYTMQHRAGLMDRINVKSVSSPVVKITALILDASGFSQNLPTVANVFAESARRESREKLNPS